MCVLNGGVSTTTRRIAPSPPRKTQSHQALGPRRSALSAACPLAQHESLAHAGSVVRGGCAMQTWLSVLVLAVVLALGSGCRSTTGESFGQNIDDTKITSDVKRKLAADTTSTLTSVSVTTVRG